MRLRQRRSTQLGRTYQPGEVIVREGEVGNSMFVVQFGEVDVCVDSPQGEILLRRLGPGDFFGELAVFDRSERSATVRASGEARILTLDKRTLLRRFHEDPSLAYRVVETLAHRVRELTHELTEALEAAEHDTGQPTARP